MAVMPGLDLGIHELLLPEETSDGRVSLGHDDVGDVYRTRRDSPSTKASTSATAL